MRRISLMIRSATYVAFSVTTSARFLHKRTGVCLSEEEQRELEEEEFCVMDAVREEDELFPIVYRLAKKADALDAELRRLSYILFEKPQLVVDNRPATITGRPVNIVKVIKTLHVDNSLNYCLDGWKRPLGSSFWGLQAVYHTSHFFLRLFGYKKKEKEIFRQDQLVTFTSNLDYLRKMKTFYALNFYSRINLIPKRHIWLAIYAVLWNIIISIQNSLGCVIFYPLREIQNDGIYYGFIKGIMIGFFRAFQFLTYGLFLSPLIHIPCGLCNSFYGIWNAMRGNLFFEATTGRWQYSTVVDATLLLRDIQLEQRVIRTIGRVEFCRKNMKPEERWKQRLNYMGFSFDQINQKIIQKGKQRQLIKFLEKETNDEDPYEVLRVGRSATQAQIKAQYKNLVKILHPDVIQSHHGKPLSDEERRYAQHKFERISQAYQILSNSEKRKSYDIGGIQALRLHESKMGRFMSRTPEEMIQSVFGGEPFRQKLLGSLLRSHWHLRNEAQVSVSLHEFEELQCLRCRELSVELAHILDVHTNSSIIINNKHHTRHGDSDVLYGLINELGGSTSKHKPHVSSKRFVSNTTTDSLFTLTPGTNEYNCFSKDFEERCDRFTDSLAEACFGRELMYEVGLSYIISSQRFLGIRPFYAPKLHVYKKIFSGIDRIYAAFREKIDDRAKNNLEWLSQKVMIEYFSMEFDAVVADMSVVLRYTAQNVLQDVTLSKEQRRRRCYALWYLGEQMVHKGIPWSSAITKRDDGELMAYLQQAANSASTTSKPRPF